MPGIARSLTLTIALATAPVAAATPSSHDAVAVAAVADAIESMKAGRYADAVAQLDLASELEPTWSEPVQLREQILATMAERYEPSAAFEQARASELQRLAELEPSPAAEARARRASELQARSEAIAQREVRRRKLFTPALVMMSVSVGFVVAGAMLYGMKPREILQPTAYRQERRDRAGIALMAAGGAMLPPGIVLAVLAGRQARRDAAVRDFRIETGRPRAVVGTHPTMLTRGAGWAVNVRF